MSEMIRQYFYNNLIVQKEDEKVVCLRFVDAGENVNYTMIGRDSITPLILALLKLNPSSIPEVLNGIEEIKK